MKTKQEFTEAFSDQFSGFLLSAFCVSEKPDMTEKARFMNNRLKQVVPTLEKMWEFIAEVQPEPVKSTAELVVDDVARVFPTLNAEGREKMREKLRALFAPAKETNGKK
jgi:hypothetical protein